MRVVQGTASDDRTGVPVPWRLAKSTEHLWTPVDFEGWCLAAGTRPGLPFNGREIEHHVLITRMSILIFWDHTAL